MQLAVAAVEYHPVVPDHHDDHEDEDGDGDHDHDEDDDDNPAGNCCCRISPRCDKSIVCLCLNRLEILLNKHTTGKVELSLNESQNAIHVYFLGHPVGLL